MDDPIRTRRDVAIRIVLSENEWDAVLKIVMAVSFAAAFAPVASKHDLPCASRYQKMMDDLSALSALAGEAPSENPPIVDIRNLMFTLLEQITPVVWDAARNESSTPPDEKSGLITGSMYPTPAGQGTTTPPPSEWFVGKPRLLPSETEMNATADTPTVELPRIPVLPDTEQAVESSTAVAIPDDDPRVTTGELLLGLIDRNAPIKDIEMGE